MQWVGSFLIVSFFLTAPVLARHEVQLCGTTAETANERLFLHKQSVRARARTPLSPRLFAEPLPRVNRNIGDIAIIEDTNGVVVRQNQFNLDLKTLQFIPTRPSASHYRYEVTDQGYDAPAAASGAPVAALDDDDARAVTLPWAFPFFGASYTAVFVNSDGNLTFGEGDSSSSERSLGRVTSGPPRISPLFDDLDPSRTAGGVRVLADAARVVVSWVAVPEWQDSGVGARQTFQASLYRDGRIAFSYSGVSAESSVVGIAPGGLAGGVTLVDFRNDASAEYAAAITERFGNALTIDIVTAAQKFYETHEDAYDYLVIYNNMNIDAQPGAVAYESTVRSRGTGFGVVPRDDGRQYGSASRLLAVLNMGQLGQYPTDPNALVPKRATAGDTPLTTIGHEAGHLFLARASVADPNDPTARPMLGFQNAHWSFVFNSEASLMEGERILDKGPEANPRFLTTDIAQGFAPLDQYLMGWRRPQDVPDMFLVTGTPSFLQPLHPLRGYSFHGQRRDISIGEIIQNMGRRTPDSTVAQRRFRFAFILVVAQGAEPPAADVAKIERFRQQFEPFFADAATGNATAQTSLRQALLLSLSPASGIVAGASAQGVVSVSRPGAAPLTVHFQVPNGYVRFPESITIPAGAKTATFSYSGISTGVEDVAAVPDDPAYETAFARVQVAGANILKLRAVSGDQQIASSAGPLPEPIVVRLTDDNGLTYSGARVMAAASSGGSATPPAAVSGADGLASFVWSPGSAATNELQLSVEGLPSVSLLLQAGRAVPVATAVVNSASFERGVAAGAIESIFGANLAGGRVLLNGTAAPVLYASDTQINFYVPAETPLGAARISVISPTGAEATTDVTVAAVHPGIFPGAAIHAGTVLSAVTTPTRAGQFIEIYCTGLGPTRTVNGLQQTVVRPTVFFGATPVQPVFSGLAPGYPGLYQVNVQVPPGLAGGMQDLVLTTSQLRSNQIQIAVQ